MNGNISNVFDRSPPFVLRLSKDERGVFQQNRYSEPTLCALLDVFRANGVDASVFNRLAWEAPRAEIPVETIEQVLVALVIRYDEKALAVAMELADFYFFSKEDPHSCDEQLLFQLITAPYFFRRDKNVHIDYSWHRVAEGFRIRFPTRDLELFDVILSQEKDNLGFRHSSYPTQIADVIVRDHPDDTWAIVSKNLEPNEDRSWRLEMWLGEEFSFDDDKVIGPIIVFNPDSVMEWIMKDPKKRAGKILRCLPKTLDEKHGEN